MVKCSLTNKQVSKLLSALKYVPKQTEIGFRSTGVALEVVAFSRSSTKKLVSTVTLDSPSADKSKWHIVTPAIIKLLAVTTGDVSLCMLGDRLTVESESFIANYIPYSKSETIEAIAEFHQKDAKFELYPVEGWADEIRALVPFVSHDSHQLVLTGVFHQSGWLVATDTHRLGVTNVAGIEYEPGFPLGNFPGDAISYALRLNQAPELGVGDRCFICTDDSVVSCLIFDQLAGTYPNWERVVPAEITKELLVDVGRLESAVKRALVVGAANACRIRFSFMSGNQLNISARGDDIEYVETIEYSGVLGTDFEVALNGKFVLQALTYVGGDTIKFGATESSRPVVLAKDGNEVRKMIIMPMTLQ